MRSRRRSRITARSSSHLDFLTPVSIQAAAQPGGQRRFKLVAYSGEPLRLSGFDLPVVIDLASADLSEQRIPALYDHCPDEGYIVGQVLRLSVDGPSGTPPLTAEGVFTPRAVSPGDDRPDYARVVLERADGGFQWQASVGGDPASVDRIQAGQSVACNGRTYPGPVYVARGVMFREISFVVLGADRMTSVVVARHPHRRLRAGRTAPDFGVWLTSLGFGSQSRLTDIQRTNLRQVYDRQFPTDPGPTVDRATAPTSTA